MLLYLQSNREEEVRMINVAIIGFGVVGSGVYEIITRNKAVLKKNTGEDIRVKRVLDIRDFSEHEQKEVFTKEFDDILSDGEISIVAETMGGVRFAYDYTKALLESGKNVVTSNKELVAKHGDEFFEIARKNNVRYLYEASVGGGIPIIRPIANDIAANNITEIAGILNGTTNYILTKMFGENQSFETALKTAQELGYAEKDPTADVDGIDACRKIAILMSLATGKKVDSEEIYTKGIRNLTEEDVAYAAALNCTIKLVGMGSIENGKVSASVSPMLIEKSCPLSGVEDVFNAVMVRGNMCGTLMFYGRGAGKLPTASAVVGDIVDIVRNPGFRKEFAWKGSNEKLLSCGSGKAKYFVRIKKEQRAAVSAEFGEIEIIRGLTDYGFVTPKISGAELDERIAKIGGAVSKMRIFR